MLRQHYCKYQAITLSDISALIDSVQLLTPSVFLFFFSAGEEDISPGYLEPTVFLPGAGEHTVEPLDANNISWASPLLPALNFAALTEGGAFANAFVFALGLAMIFIVVYIARRMKIFASSTQKGYNTTQYHTDQEPQVSRLLNAFLDDCDISNHVFQMDNDNKK